MFRLMNNHHLFNSAIRAYGRKHQVTEETNGNRTLYKDESGRVIAKHTIYKRSEQLCLLEELVPLAKDINLEGLATNV